MNDSDQQVAAFLCDGQPAWDKIDFEVHCSRCGYNLYTLQQPRCPECGLQFAWRDVLDRSAWQSDFLFEHHWRSRPAHSWLKTFTATMRPFHFWRRISIHDRVHAGPLWFLLGSTGPIFVIMLPATALVTRLLASMGGFLLGFIDPAIGRVLGDLAVDLQRQPAAPSAKQAPVLLGTVFLVVLVALGVLASLRQTLGRCRVRTVQILRVVAYAAPASCALYSVLFVFLNSVTYTVYRLDLSYLRIPAELVNIAVPLAVPAVFLCAGLKCYLRLPRAILLAIAAVLIAGLFVFTVFAVALVVRLGR